MATAVAYGLAGLVFLGVPVVGGFLIWWEPEYALRKLALRYPRVLWFVDPISYRGIQSVVAQKMPLPLKSPEDSAQDLQLTEPEDNSAWSVLTYILPNKDDLFDPAIRQRQDKIGQNDMMIGLTIDDGPDPLYTLSILEILKKYNATATMFFIGQNLVDYCDDPKLDPDEVEVLTPQSSEPMLTHEADNPGPFLVKLPKSKHHVERIQNFVSFVESLGHEVGNHTWFDRRTANISSQQLEQELEWFDQILFSNWSESSTLKVLENPPPISLESCLSHSASILDKLPVSERKKRKFFRPGHGYFNDGMVSQARARNYSTVIGSVYPHDPHIPVSHVTSWHVLSRARPGAVIALHDARTWTLETIERVVKGLVEKGYKVVSVGELMDWGDVNGAYPGGKW